MHEGIRSGDTLGDWGEFRLLNEMILPILRQGSAGESLGNDCAFISLGTTDEELVVTTDVGPKPLAWELGHKSYWTWGWYSVVANASDLAAAGAEPLAFTTSVEAPAEMKVSEFEDYFRGMDAACTAFGLKNAGGNIRVAPRFACHGTAIGTIPKHEQFGRSNCEDRDIIFAIGKCGLFITSYLKAQRLGSIDLLDTVEREALLMPYPRAREMQALRAAKVLSAATDNSDGVLGSLWNIIERSEVAIELWLDESHLPEYVVQESLHHELDPRNLFLFWGDWQIIVSVKSTHLKEFQEIVAREGIEAHEIGVAVAAKPGIFGVEHGRRRPLKLLRNENFVARSFNQDAVSHTDYLLKSDLYATE